MAVDVSSSSPSFRELDDVFLQSQTRIWLGEVLHTRFDEQLSICDLLSDGELLFEVSNELWNMLLVKYMELKSYKGRILISVDRRKSSGRYRPYSNVDSFLKVCKVLGLSGIDLFSPSDVVEKKDTRKVCICIRFLSKKARSKQLNVPDFDIVTNTVSMPTNVVRCIRRSLELSTCSVAYGKSKNTKSKTRQKSSRASHKQEEETYLEESDDIKSKFSYADTRNRETDKFEHTPESAESLLVQYVSGDNQLCSSPVCESRFVICDNFTTINHGANFWLDNGENALNVGEVDHHNHHVSSSDIISYRILTDVPFHIFDDCLCQSCMSTEMWNSVTPRVLDFDVDSDFDAKSEPEDLRTLVSSTPDQQECVAAKRLDYKVSGLNTQSELEIMDLSPDSSSRCWDEAKSYCSLNQDLDSQNQFARTQKDSLLLIKDNVTNINADINQENVDERNSAEANTNRRTDNMENRRNYLFRTVAKGTALIGILFLLNLSYGYILYKGRVQTRTVFRTRTARTNLGRSFWIMKFIDEERGGIEWGKVRVRNSWVGNPIEEGGIERLRLVLAVLVRKTVQV